MIPYGGQFLWGANFCYFRGSFASYENFHQRKLMPVQLYVQKVKGGLTGGVAKTSWQHGLHRFE